MGCLRGRFRLVKAASLVHKPEAPAKPIEPPSAAPSRPVNLGRGSGPDRCSPSHWGLVPRVSGRIAFGAPCPQRSLAREASTMARITWCSRWRNTRPK